MASTVSLNGEISSDESSTSSISTLLQHFVAKVNAIIDKVAKDRNLERSVVMARMSPIDICVFGRSGIGKSELMKAITGMDFPSSPQLDHMTQKMTHVTTIIGSSTFRFWDTRGIDNWLDMDVIDNIFDEMKEKQVKPIFIIYCAASGGRIDSDIVGGILTRFAMQGVLICYVITNMYGGSLEQLEEQVRGGLAIMNHVFTQNVQMEKDKYCYLYSNDTNINEESTSKTASIMIAVNSRPFSHFLGTFPTKNITELMDFLAGHLRDEEFVRFVALTINNRSFWTRVGDAIRTRFLRVKNSFASLKHQLVTFSIPFSD